MLAATGLWLKMNKRFRLVGAGSLLIASLVGALLLSGVIPLEPAVSDQQGGGEIDVRVQARETAGGLVEVRAQSRDSGGEWTTHTPRARFMPSEPAPGRWYSSSPVAVRAVAVQPEQSDAASYTQWFVAEAIARFERDGRDAAVEYYNSSGSAEGRWYVFIIDEQDILIAHPDQDLVGTEASDHRGPDGYPFGRMVLAVASEDGAWVDYQLANRATGQAELKHSWIVRRSGLTFGSGWYEGVPSKEHAPGAFTQSYVARALELYRVLGREATFEYYNTSESADGPWYMFIHETDGTRVAHAHRSGVEGWLGSNVGETGIDVTGFDYGDEILAIETSGWVSYVFLNPADENQYQRKHSWIVTHDGLQFGSGWYDRHYDLASEDPAGYAKVLVQQAIDRYEAEGREQLLAFHNSPESVDGEWYVSIYELDGTRLAHPWLPLGENLLDGGPDVTGRNFRAEFVAVEDRGWVSYVFLNPESGAQEQKHTWIVQHAGLLFTCGWYEAGAYEAPDS